MSQVITSTASPPIERPSRAEWRNRFAEGPTLGLLESTSRLKMFLASGSTFGWGTAACIGVAVVAVFVDAMLALPTAGLFLLDAIIIGASLAALVAVVRQIVVNRFQPQRTARLVEEQLGIRNSVFINAVEFASEPPRTDSALLRERAIRIADEKAHSISSFDVLKFTRLYRAAGAMFGAVLITTLLGVMAPKVFGMVLPRLWDPAGGHPPYTLVEFDVRITPEPVYHGRSATIAVALGGPETVDQAAVVFLNDDEDQEPIPMFRTGDQEFALHIERATESRPFYIDTPSGRSATSDFVVVEVPFFEDARVEYEYPAYTGWQAHEHRLDGRPLRALLGTQLKFTCRSNLALESGRLVLTPESEGDEPATPIELTLTPNPDDPQEVIGALPVKVGGSYELSLVSTAGAESIESLEGRLIAVPDRHPSVAIVSPGPYIVVVENWQVPVTIEALDDVGISRLRLYRSVNGWGPNDVELEFDRPQLNTARAQTEFDLPTLGARAGDIIEYYVSAYDNHPSGAQFTDSDKHVIQVISEEEYQQFARQQYQMDDLISEFEAIRESLDRLQKQREELLEELEELRKQIEDGAEATPKMLQRMQELEEQLQKYSRDAQALAENINERAEQLQLYELEEPYLEMLRKMSEQLEQQASNASQVAESMSQMQQQSLNTPSRESFEQAESQFREQNDPFNQEMQEQLDSAAQDMEMYRQADALMGAADRLRSVIAMQREIADRLAEFRDQANVSPADQARADRFAKDQELLEQELQDTVREMREAAEAAQQDLPQMSSDALALCDKIGSMEIPADQQQAAQSARAGEGRESHTAAESAAEKLESLLSECSACQNCSGEMSNNMDGPLKLPKDRMQQCLNQLAQGRGVPGLGSKPGQGQGQGQQPGQGGFGMNGQGGMDGMGQGSQPRWQPGQTFPGSQAPITVMGPHTMEQGDRDSPSGRLGGEGRGQWVPFGSDEYPLGAEMLTPEARDALHSATGSLRGVPVPYLGEAEAYFRRLAEEE